MAEGDVAFEFHEYQARDDGRGGYAIFHTSDERELPIDAPPDLTEREFGMVVSVWERAFLEGRMRGEHETRFKIKHALGFGEIEMPDPADPNRVVLRIATTY